MKKHVLRMRQTDKFIFNSIKEGLKTIETRAATDKHRRITEGDILVFACAGEKLEKKIKKVDCYKTIDQMIEKIDFKKVIPFIDSIEEMKKVYFSFPGYKEKINQFGLIAFELAEEH